MATTYRDYLWFKDDEFTGWHANGHVVSLIRDATAAGVLNALGAVGRRRTGVGFAGFGRQAMEFEMLGLVRPDPYANQTVQTVGVADICDGWVLLIQQASDYLGIDDELFGPVIAHHEVVSHYSNINGFSQFIWWRDGERKVSFEPMIPTMDLERARTRAPEETDTVLRLIAEVGGIDLDDYDGTSTEFFHIEGSFALAERLTGVEVSRQLLESAEFTVAMIPSTGEPDDPYAHDIPPRVPLLDDHANWGDVHQLYRSAAEATVHGRMVLIQGSGDGKEREEVEFWYTPFRGTRQVDADGARWVERFPNDYWYRGPYPPNTWPEKLVRIQQRWEPDTPFRSLLDPTTPATPTDVNGRRAWELVLPADAMSSSDVTIAFDALTGIPLRAESVHRIEELHDVVLDEAFSDDLFALPEEHDDTRPA